MAMALAAALPGALESAAAALDLPHHKDQAGVRLMRQMARPLYLDAETGKPIWIEDAKRLERLCAYCACDVAATRALYERLPSLSDDEQSLWTLDAEINRRGFYVDVSWRRPPAISFAASRPRSTPKSSR